MSLSQSAIKGQPVIVKNPLSDFVTSERSSITNKNKSGLSSQPFEVTNPIMDVSQQENESEYFADQQENEPEYFADQHVFMLLGHAADNKLSERYDLKDNEFYANEKTCGRVTSGNS